MRLVSLDDAIADVTARRLDGDGEYTLHLRFDPQRMDASLAVHEPASGPLENLLALPGLGALSATATLAGPHSAERIDLVLGAGGLRGRVQGSVDLVHGSADLDYLLSAPAMAPRPDVSWAGISLKGTWHGPWSTPIVSGRLDVDALRVAQTTRISKLTADLTGSAGKLNARATVEGLEIPGPQSRIFSKSPVAIDASLSLDQPLRPLDVQATHALFSVRGHADTQAGKAGEYNAAAELKIPDLAPFAALGAQDVRGTALINARLIHGRDDDALSLDSSFGFTGGGAGWIRYIGPRATLQVAGTLSDKNVKIDRLKLTGRGVMLTADGGAARTLPHDAAAEFIRDLEARWQIDISDLAVLSGDVAGNLQARENCAVRRSRWWPRRS